MIKSMTGYGKAEAEISGKRITVEVRSLNSKQLDLSVKLPGSFRRAEYDIRLAVGKALVRGKADVYISVAGENCSAARIDAALFADYCHQFEQASNDVGIYSVGEVARTLMATSILRMPDVVGTDSAELGDQGHQALMQAVGRAISHLDDFRMQEGQKLQQDLLCRVENIRSLMHSVEPYEKPRVELVRNRIRENIASMNLPADSNRLEQEMIFYIEKLDITEEKVRLENHCDYFCQVASQEEGAGRKLGFIAQEMGREINTMGSKANDASIQKIVVEMKDELEKIKEQVLNIL